MRIHREGYTIFSIYLSLAILINIVLSLNGIFSIPLLVICILGLIPLLIFFRNPTRTISQLDNNLIYAPCDGKVVAIEEVTETEYFNDQRIQISIFMSPLNVHVNRNPIGGEVKYSQYHEGKYLVAWHPKSSTENERTTVVIDSGEEEIMLRQIAGALAKRIKNYLDVGDWVEQGSEMGFIKFGSRVDLFLPLDAKMEVEIGQKVRGNKTVIAKL